MNSELERLAEQAETALISFLRAELQLGFTYANTAKVENGFDPLGQKRARQLAKDALETIERFRPRVADPAIQEELRKGARELEAILSATPTPGM